MEKFPVGLIRVLTVSDPVERGRHGALVMRYFPELSVASRCIPGQPEGVHDPESEARAVPKILALGRELAGEGVQMLLVSCAADPGVEELRRELAIPVAGAGTCAAAVAAQYSGLVGVLGITAETPPAYTRLLGGRIAGSLVPEGVRTTLDLSTQAGFESCVRTGRELLVRGARVIALACTGMSPIGLAPALERELAIPVVDPVLAEGLFAAYEARRAR